MSSTTEMWKVHGRAATSSHPPHLTDLAPHPLLPVVDGTPRPGLRLRLLVHRLNWSRISEKWTFDSVHAQGLDFLDQVFTSSISPVLTSYRRVLS